MKYNKDFSGIMKTLMTNGVGFIKCFFESNQSEKELRTGALEDSRPSIVNFSDGNKYLATLTIDDVHFGSISGKRYPFTHYCVGIRPPGFKKKKIDIDFLFNVGSRRGECTIMMRGKPRNKK